MSQLCHRKAPKWNMVFLLTGNAAHISISANVSSLHSMPFALVESPGDCMNGGRGGGGMWNFGGGPGPSHASVPHSKSPSNIFHIELIYIFFFYIPKIVRITAIAWSLFRFHAASSTTSVDYRCAIFASASICVTLVSPSIGFGKCVLCERALINRYSAFCCCVIWKWENNNNNH